MLEPEELIGQQIKHYRIQGHIDRGGMADVYLAFDETLHRRIALKIMLPAFAHDRQFVDRFWREAQTAAQLDHPHIIQVFEIGNTEDQRPYIAMQFIEGGSLKDKLMALKGELIPVEEALGIIRQVAVALGVAHDAGIVHRDVKPSNILLRPDGSPVLVDLGIAAVKTGQKLTQTGTLIGTPHYMSPEQVGGERVDGRSDIYSLGVVLYELLCGRRPFEADDPLAVLHKHVYEEPYPLPQRRPGLNQQTYRLVGICLQKTPDHRYQTMGEFTAAIDRAIQAEQARPSRSPARTSHRALETTRVGRPVPASRPEGRRRPAWLLALIPVVLLGLFGAYQLFSGGARDDATTPAISPSEGTSQVQAVAVQDSDAQAASPGETPTLEPTPVSQESDTPGEGIPTETVMPTATMTPTPTELPPSETPIPPSPTALPDLGPEWIEIGRSVLGTPIEVVRFGAGETSVLFIGGLHAGAAPSSVTIAEQAITYFQMNPEQVPLKITLYVIPSAGPDSPLAPGELRGRLNANGVDLNRNWDCRWVSDAQWRGSVVAGSGGPFPFSEPETQALVSFIRENEIAAVVFWEARAVNGLVSPGTCGERTLVSGRLAQAYGLAAGYPIADFETLTDQEVNGDSTNWLDLQGIAAISVLLPEYDETDWNNNLAGILGVLAEYSR